MFRNTVLATIALLASSCGGDESDAPATERKLLKRMTMFATYPEDNQQAVFTYDSRSRIEKIQYDGALDDTFTFSYNNQDQVTAITKFSGEDLTFEYDADGRLSSYTKGNVDHAVTYNSGSQTYTVDGVAYVMKENGDILSENGSVYQYATHGSLTLKGPLRDAVGSSYHLAGMIADPGSVIYMVKDSFKGRIVPGNPNDISNYSFTNTYNAQDYEVGSHLSVYGLEFDYSYEYYD